LVKMGENLVVDGRGLGRGRTKQIPASEIGVVCLLSARETRHLRIKSR
jgi:hypothetical protein